MNISQSFSSRLSLYVITTMSILTVAALTALFFSSRAALESEAADLADNNLRMLTTNVETVLSNVATATENYVWLVQVNSDSPDYMYKITENFVKSNEIIVGSTVAFVPNYFKSKGEYFAPYTFLDNFDGKYKSIQMGNDEYHYFDMEWFSEPYRLDKSRWSEPYFDEGGGDQLMTTYSVPVHDSLGNVVAILTADVSLESLTRDMKNVKLYGSSYSFILSRSGQYMAHPDSSKLLTTTIFDVAERVHSEELADLGEKMLNGQSGHTNIKMSFGDTYSVVYGPISNGWSTCYFCPYEEIYGELRNQLFISIIVAVLNMLLLFFVVRRIILRTSKPITEFAFTALNIAKGNFDTQLPEVKTQDEIKRLHDALAFMVKSIREYMYELTTATATKERIESELSIASSIQNQMLSKDFPKNGTIDLNAVLHPAKEVGGDLYDFFIKEDKLYFAIGDVSGKGVPASLIMAITRSAFRFIASLGMRQSEIMSHVNNAICDGNEINMFVTMFIAKLDLNTGKVHFCNAGHNPFILVHPDGKAEYFHCKANLAVGLFGDFPYEDEEFVLEKGSRILLYTDGVSEAENRSKELFGEERLLAAVSAQSSDLSSEEFVSNILAEVRAFTAGNEQNDDITMLSFKY